MKHLLASMAIFVVSLAHTGPASSASHCFYKLDTSQGANGNATARIKNGHLRITISNGLPDTLYTVWIDFKNRDSGLLAFDYPLADGALERGVAPAFAITAPVRNGIGYDANAIVTDKRGFARKTLRLDYKPLREGHSPVVSNELTMQGLNRIGGYWLRKFEFDETLMASAQYAGMGRRNRQFAKVHRATAQGITIVSHPDYITHGHTPGVKNVDHFSGFSGDFPDRCL